RDRRGDDRHTCRFERREHGRYGTRSFVGAGAQHASVEHRLAHTRNLCERGKGAVDGADELKSELLGDALVVELDGTIEELALQLVGRAGRDDAPTIDDREASG